MPRRSGEAHLYRLNHALAEAVIARAKERELAEAEVRFDYDAHQGKVTILQPLLNSSGWLILSVLTVEALDQAEDYLIFSSVTDSGLSLDEEQVQRLLSLPGQVSDQRMTLN